MPIFGRVVTAMVTPFNPDGAVDLEKAADMVTWLTQQNGSDGLVICGSTGESPTLDFKEKVALFKTARQATKAKITAGVGSYDTRETIDLAKAAEQEGADGLLVVTPYYNKPPQTHLIKHFTQVADATELPMMLYDVPSRTATKIEPATLKACAEHPRIKAVKEASGDFSAVANYGEQMPAGFELYSGNDDHTLPLQAWGAVGVVSVLSHLVGNTIKQQFDAFEKGDIATARKIQVSYQDLYNAVFATSNPIGVKAALKMLGKDVGGSRPPLYEADEQTLQRIRKSLDAAKAAGTL